MWKLLIISLFITSLGMAQTDLQVDFERSVNLLSSEKREEWIRGVEGIYNSYNGLSRRSIRLKGYTLERKTQLLLVRKLRSYLVSTKVSAEERRQFLDFVEKHFGNEAHAEELFAKLIPLEHDFSLEEILCNVWDSWSQWGMTFLDSPEDGATKESWNATIGLIQNIYLKRVSDTNLCSIARGANFEPFLSTPKKEIYSFTDFYQMTFYLKAMKLLGNTEEESYIKTAYHLEDYLRSIQVLSQEKRIEFEHMSKIKNGGKLLEESEYEDSDFEEFGFYQKSKRDLYGNKVKGILKGRREPRDLYKGNSTANTYGFASALLVLDNASSLRAKSLEMVKRGLISDLVAERKVIIAKRKKENRNFTINEKKELEEISEEIEKRYMEVPYDLYYGNSSSMRSSAARNVMFYLTLLRKSKYRKKENAHLLYRSVINFSKNAYRLALFLQVDHVMEGISPYMYLSTIPYVAEAFVELEEFYGDKILKDEKFMKAKEKVVDSIKRLYRPKRKAFEKPEMGRVQLLSQAQNYINPFLSLAILTFLKGKNHGILVEKEGR